MIVRMECLILALLPLMEVQRSEFDEMHWQWMHQYQLYRIRLLYDLMSRFEFVISERKSHMQIE